jgi:SAM-dependent methyltransferase
VNEDDFREYWQHQTDSNHPARPGIDVFPIGAGEIQAFLGDAAGRRVLEIGCGAGELFQHLRLDRAGYLGVDFSDSSLREFRARHPGVRVVKGEAATFSIAETFDFVIVNNVLQYCRPLTTMSCLLNLGPMLAPGGRVLLGNVPNRSQRLAYLRGLFSPEPRGVLARAWRLLRGWLAILGSDTDRIGFWYTPQEIGRMAGQAGFDCAIFGCLLYPYRFSALLSRKGPR